MKFPLYDISEENWKKDKHKQHNVVFENPYRGIQPIDQKQFLEQISQFRYLDCDGNVYQPHGFKFHQAQSFWKKILRIGKIELEFDLVQTEFSFDDFQRIIVSRAMETGDETLLNLAKEASSIEEILQNT